MNDNVIFLHAKDILEFDVVNQIFILFNFFGIIHTTWHQHTASLVQLSIFLPTFTLLCIIKVSSVFKYHVEHVVHLR